MSFVTPLQSPSAPPPGEAASGLVLEEGKVLARKYRLVRPAGFGGMAHLWVATNASTGAEVCIKIFMPDAKDEESILRFRREAHAAAVLSHRAIVQVFDLMELDANGEAVKPEARPHALAIVMELLSGETLTDYIMARGKLSVDEALDIAIPMVGALAHAHRAGVVHRDVKPDNIFIARDPDGAQIPKVLDFGVSKIATDPLTAAGVVLGTPSYMSPEQAKGAPTVDARSDVFSAGIVIYMMLSGKNPFEDDNFTSILQAIVEREPERIPGVSDLLWSVLEKALAKKPAQRWNDGTELQLALRRASGRRSLSIAENGPQSVSAISLGQTGPVRPPSAPHIPVGGRPAADSELSLRPFGTQSSIVPPAPISDEDVGAGLPGSSGRSARWAVAAAAFVVATIAIVGGRALMTRDQEPAGRASAGHVAAEAPPSNHEAVKLTATTPAESASAPSAGAAAADAHAPATKPDGARKERKLRDAPKSVTKSPGAIGTDPGF